MRAPVALSDRPSTGQLPRPPLNIAHRGASAVAPENTLAAVRKAVALGADGIEVDVQRTRDGALVVLHDTTLTRTTDIRRVLPRRAPWSLADLTLEEVRRLDAGGWKAPRFRGERIPTLAEVLAVTARAGVLLQLELKHPRLHPGIVEQLADVLSPNVDGAAAAAAPVVVQSFDFTALKELKTRLPDLPVGLLGTPAPANLAALATWADQVNPAHRAVDAAYVESVHRHGMQCLVWTVDRVPAMRRAIGLGVDGVITNRPRRFGRVCRTGQRPVEPVNRG